MKNKNKKHIKTVPPMEGDLYEFCLECNTHKKKAGPCTRCIYANIALEKLDPYSDIDIYGFHPSFGYIGHSKPRRATKEIHRALQVYRLKQALNHAWICNINWMLRYAQSHDGVNKVCIIVFHDTDLRHLILQIVHNTITNGWGHDLISPLQWP